ncbi:MAG: PKD domain-containing protein [Nanoarchaeota archaeon]|nr:PKD domain-containing protein [Nanoarchaeota archaeon]
MGAIKTFRVQETDLVTLSPEALDPDNDQVTYSFLPPLDKNGQWQTGYDDAGEYHLKIIASDGVHETAKEVMLVVQNKNQPPYLKEKKVTVKELQTLDLKQFVADPDADPLEYVFTKPFDKNGLWSPGYDDQGTFVATFSVKDGEFIVPMRVEVDVLDTNQPPKIVSSFSDQEEVDIKEGETFSFYVDAVDGDNDKMLYVWALNGQPLSQDKQGEHIFNYDSAGRYKLALMVSDGKGHQVEKKWIIQVENVNRKPNVKLLPLTVKEGEVVSLELPEKDLDEDALTYSFDEKFDESGHWQTTYEDAGEYSIAHYVSDGTEKVKEKVEVTVLNVDRAPELHLPEKLEVKEGEKLSLVVDSVDPDGEKVEIFFVNAPEGGLYDPDTNTFTWSPGYDYIKRRGGMLSNILNALRLEQRLLREKKEVLEVKACSQDLCSTGKVALLIYNCNRAPVLEITLRLTISEAELLQLQPNSYDPDGDIVRYYFTEPAHKRKGHWETAYEDAGEYTIYVTATDGVYSQTLLVAVTVLQKNRPPAVAVPRDQYALREGEEFVLSIGSFDSDHDALALHVENLPEGASFKNNTLVWTPPYSFAASKNKTENSLLSEASFLGKGSENQREHWISFVASDQEFDVNHPVKLMVRGVNQKPEIKNVAPLQHLTLYQGQPFNFSVNVFDLDGNNLSYTWNFEPGTDIVTGSDVVERTFVTPGEKKVSVVVSDGEYEVSQEWTVTVEELPKPESIALEEPKFRVYVIEH